VITFGSRSGFGARLAPRLSVCAARAFFRPKLPILVRFTIQRWLAASLVEAFPIMAHCLAV
jgi:hypothetical protein